ncbi:MAG TPA: MBOAT family O-acyltransferase [Longilinea sp.]|nr:MBOAT family O-acyltransferase [Longilinea sp.]
MTLDSPLFLFLFLPITLAVVFFIPRRFKFAVLLLLSLLYYAWFEPVLIFAALMITLWGFWLAIEIGKSGDNEIKAKRWLLVGVISNIGGLLLVKILGINFTGLSFLVFVILAYLFDVFNQLIQPERSIWKFLFHAFFFPKVVSGPIMRYQQTSEQLENFKIDLKEGVLRLIIGLAKKMLLANPLGIITDSIFNISAGTITPAIAWIGAICYALQIYYDFSGYSDMAIGLGRFFGFNIPENFNYPYLATSITNFWRRWHITLSNWFRDYVFLPLEISRRRSPYKWFEYVNILIVFGLVGIWHGLDWTFIIWGLLHGFCISLETLFKNRYKKYPGTLKRVYTLLILLIGWVFFRSPTVQYALAYLKSMVGIYNPGQLQVLLPMYFSPYNFGLMAFGIFFAVPMGSWIGKFFEKKQVPIPSWMIKPIEAIGLLILFVLSLLAVADSTYQAFIYFQF